MYDEETADEVFEVMRRVFPDEIENYGKEIRKIIELGAGNKANLETFLTYCMFEAALAENLTEEGGFAEWLAEQEKICRKHFFRF